MGLYSERYFAEFERWELSENAKWERFRIQWADFRNVNRKKNAKAIRPQDLLKLPYDDKLPQYHEIDMEAMKRKFGSKIKKRGQ